VKIADDSAWASAPVEVAVPGALSREKEEVRLEGQGLPVE
jgi:hypothetical protein